MKTILSKSVRCCLTLIFAAFLFCSTAYAQTLTSDTSDYAPGTVCTLTGSGFGAGETVTLVVHHADGTPDSGADHDPWSVTADDNGNLKTTKKENTDDC